MPTVISGLRMKRLCCFPLIQKNCHNPRKKRGGENKQKQTITLVFGNFDKFQAREELHKSTGFALFKTKNFFEYDNECNKFLIQNPW